MKFSSLLFLLRNVQVQIFEKGHVLIPSGSKKQDLYFIKKGLVRSYKELKSAELAQITFQLYNEYHVFGNIHTIFLNEPSHFSYEALEQTKAYVIDFTTFDEKVSSDSSLSSFSRKFLGKRMIEQAFQRVESFVFLTPEERYQKYVKDYPNVVNRAPDKYIANILGITPTSLSRIRKRIASKKG